MSKVITLTLLLYFTAALSSSFAGTETIVPEDTLSIENNWSTNAGGDKVAAVTDGIDSLYIYATTSGQIQRYVMTDESTIPADATIDSFTVAVRAQKTTSSTTRIRIRLRMDGNTNYCDGANITLTTSWANYSETFTATPTGGGVCAGSLTKPRIDSLNVQMLSILVPIAGQASVTDIDVTVYFTESGAATVQHRRRKLLLISKQEEIIYDDISSADVTFGNYNPADIQLWSWIWNC